MSGSANVKEGERDVCRNCQKPIWYGKPYIPPRLAEVPRRWISEGWNHFLKEEEFPDWIADANEAWQYQRSCESARPDTRPDANNGRYWSYGQTTAKPKYRCWESIQGGYHDFCGRRIREANEHFMCGVHMKSIRKAEEADRERNEHWALQSHIRDSGEKMVEEFKELGVVAEMQFVSRGNFHGYTGAIVIRNPQELLAKLKMMSVTDVALVQPGDEEEEEFEDFSEAEEDLFG